MCLQLRKPEKIASNGAEHLQNDGNAVGGGDGTDVVSSRNSTGDGGGLVLVVYTLAGEESGTTLRGLEDDGALLIASSLEGCNDSRAGGDVDGGNGVAVLLCVLEELEDIVTSDDTGLAGKNAGQVSMFSRPGFESRWYPSLRASSKPRILLFTTFPMTMAAVKRPARSRHEHESGTLTYSWAPIVIVVVL